MLQDLGLEAALSISNNMALNVSVTFQSDRSFRFEIDGSCED